MNEMTQEGRRDAGFVYLTLGVLVLVLGYRLWVALNNPLPLYVDEAYYWTWSRQLDWGYYSKPPMVAWLIALTTTVCGDGEFCVRSGALWVYPLTTWVVFLIARRLFDARIAFWSALAFFTLPAVSLSSMLISTDVLLFLFWAGSVWLFLRALERDHPADWMALGLAVGLGLTSKYTMVVFFVSMLAWLGWRWRTHGTLPGVGPWLSVGVALLVFLPNLAWNARHAYATFQHTYDISNLDHLALHVAELVEFVAGQFAVFGPVLFAILLLVWARPSRWLVDERLVFLTAFALPMLLIITLQSLLGRANANWAAPAFVTAAILVAAWLSLNRCQGVLMVGVAFNVALMPVVYHFDSLVNAAGVQLTRASDPFKRVRGWDRVGEEIRAIAAENANAHLLAEDRDLLSYLTYYVTHGQVPVYSLSETGRIQSQFDLGAPLESASDELYLYIRRRPARSDEPVVNRPPLRQVHVPIHDDYALDFDVFLLRGDELDNRRMAAGRERVIKVPARYVTPKADAAAAP